MRRWFLSYHSPDQALAERVKLAIERKDPASHVFFAPTHLRAGGSWSAQLAQEIAGATAFILLVGKAGIGKWQVPEYDEALDRWVTSLTEFPLIVILLEGQTAPGLPFLRRLHFIITSDPASDRDIARLFDALSGGGASPGELWRYTSPYRGLEAMEEKDSDYFFGRKHEIIDVLSALAGAPDRLPVLIGNSGVGKSSLAQAGVLAALKRQAWPGDTEVPNEWPATFQDSRQWCFLSLKPGTDPLRALVESFLDTWQFAATDPERVKHQAGWIALLGDGKATLPDLIDATERRRKEFDQPKPPGFFLYVDQGEELYVRAEQHQRRRFSQLLADALPDPRFRAMMSLRSDFLGQLQNDEPLFRARQQIDVPPLREAELREIISRPAKLLAARFETEGLVDIITHRTVEDSITDVGALPLLSYTLDDMWTQMVHQGDGILRLPAQSFELGGVLVDRADKFLAAHPAVEDQLRRILTLRLATVRDNGEPTRRRAARVEFSEEEWRLVSELADYPNRLLVTVTTESGETYAEVAHEAIFRRWDKLRGWIASERDFLAWRSGLEAARRDWQATPNHPDDALLMGLALTQAQSWLAKRPDDILESGRRFIEASIARENRERTGREQERLQRERLRRWTQRLAALIAVLIFGIGAGLGWSNRNYLKMRAVMLSETVWSKVLTAEAERMLRPKDSFKECADCPQMVVVRSGQFGMGSPVTNEWHQSSEEPRHLVTIARAIAISRFEATFEEWDACVTLGGCVFRASDQGWGRDRRPVINVSWEDAQQYVAWISRRTGRTYRLLSEAEWEYSARAGTDTIYSWGNDAGVGNGNCVGCGSQWDHKETAPVGSFAPNAFGLYDMHGNVWEWLEDCLHPSYAGAPDDGSPWTAAGDCSIRVVRGGSWTEEASVSRSAHRNWVPANVRNNTISFRVARTLTP